MKIDDEPVSISVVVPVYSGEEYLEQLVFQLNSLRNQWIDQRAPMNLMELILVDDSARDGSPKIVDRLAELHDWIVPLHLSRNYGQHPATIAGILYSSGNWVVTMDEDLQHPPQKISALLATAVGSASDVIYAQPIDKVHRNSYRDLASRKIKWLVGWLTGSEHVRLINSFRLIRGEIARSVSSVAIHDTYFDIEIGFFTQRIVGLPMELVDERFAKTGKSGYSFRSLVSHAWRMIFSSNLRVLRFMAVIGGGTVCLSFFIAVTLIISNLIWPDAVSVRGWASQMVATVFFGGINIAMIGIVLQYLSTLVLRAHGRPTFFVIDRSTDSRLANYFIKTST